MGLKAVATLVPGGGAPVGGSGTIGTVPKWATTSTLNDSVITQSGAYVGIGTASPSRLLTLSAADATIGPAVAQTTMIRLVNPATALSTGAGIQFGHDNTNAQTLAQISEVLTSTANQWTGDLTISLKATSNATTLTEYVRFQSGGNVGIGTTGPGCALDVVGVIKTSGYTVATLPAGAVGQRAYVTDALAPTYLGALVGGGAVYAPVFHNGTAWVSA